MLINCCKSFFVVVVGAFCGVFLNVGFANDETPSLNYILGRVWANMEMQPFELEGVIRHGSTRHPITLKTGSREMTYLLGDSEADVRVNFAAYGSQVHAKRVGGKNWERIPEQSWDRQILGTDVTYRDLALDFLAWPKVNLLGRGNAKTLPAFVLEAEAPAGSRSEIKRVKYWISSEHFVLVQAEAYNADGDVIKRFDVNGVQRFGDFWTIRQLRVADMIPKRNISRSRTFIEINRGKPILEK